MVTLYVLKGTHGKRYVGITNDLARRLCEHRSGNTRGGQIIGEFEVLLTESYPDYQTARLRERYLKSGQGRQWLDAYECAAGTASDEQSQFQGACAP